MKTTTAALPFAVLLAGASGCALQSHRIAEPEDGKARVAREHTPAKPKNAAVTAPDRQPVDWAEVAKQLKASDSAAPDNSGARLEQRLAAMTLAEINATLDEIAAAKLSAEDRELLEQRVCKELGGPKGSPALVLERFATSIGNGSWAWTLGGYFKTWIDRDPDQAIAWLAKNSGQIKYLSHGFFPMSFYPLLANDPDTAARLLDALPPDRRLDSLRSVEYAPASDAQEIAWVKIMRQHLPAKDRAQAVAWPTMNHSDGDGAPMSMSQITAYLKRIDATPAEREACIRVAATERSSAGESDHDDLKTPEWIEAFRRWVAGEAPELVDRATGLALANPFSGDSADLALRYHEMSGNDELLLPLLERISPDSESRATSRKLAEHLTDPKARRKYLDQLKPATP